MTTLMEPGTVTDRRSSRLTWAILGLVLLADALDVIDATVTNIAAPTIAGELNGGESLIKWLGPAYMLAMGVLLVVGGRLGDKFGQRRLFLIGMGGFTLASVVAGFSPDPALLIVARVAQGAFGALLIPQGMAIMTKAFSRDMLAKAFATIPVVALGDAKPDEAGSASGSFSSIQQLASAIGSAAVTSIFFQAANSGLGHAMKVTLIVVLALTAFSLPVVALMPPKAPAEPHE
jgi:MFS family permease